MSRNSLFFIVVIVWWILRPMYVTNWILYLFCITNGVLLGRLQHELMTLMVSMDKGISAFPEGDNLFKWVGTLTGPATTVSVAFFLLKHLNLLSVLCFLFRWTHSLVMDYPVCWHLHFHTWQLKHILQKYNLLVSDLALPSCRCTRGWPTGCRLSSPAVTPTQPPLSSS